MRAFFFLSLSSGFLGRERERESESERRRRGERGGGRDRKTRVGGMRWSVIIRGSMLELRYLGMSK